MRHLRELFHRLDRSLRARILLPTALLFAVTLGAMVMSAVGFYASDMESGQHEKAELFAGMVANGVTSTMLQGKPDQVGEVLAVVMSHRTDILSVSLLNGRGEVSASSHGPLVGTRPWGAAIGRFEAPTVLTSPNGHPAEYAVIQPLPNGPACVVCHGTAARFNGWLDLRFTRKTVIAQQANLARTLGLAAGVAFLCLMAIAWWLIGREAVAPLTRLVNSMKRAESGDLGVRADEARPDELGVAARGFDAMLTALRRSQTELEAFYRERMVRADRFAAVGELATGLAHEIKNPLAGLSGALELLAEDLAAQPKQAEVVQEMRHQVARLGNTMESLLSFARPPKARLRTTDVNATLDKVLFLVRQQRRAASVAIEPDLGTNLPPVLADPNQLEQVFLNICLNACQAMDGKGKLVLRTFEVDGRVTVEIEDDGPGIPTDVRAHVFKPFFTTKREGNGLGLAISARIVAEHGGHIGYRCPPSGGTVFAVTLQRAHPATGERTTEHAA
ncbi:MAG TPA: ATP-binding protein [Anaeromyxobacteraceae bacterium]|nr:ATP-binding protein [Anaeromyxobacteraceae bacterium]